MAFRMFVVSANPNHTLLSYRSPLKQLDLQAHLYFVVIGRRWVSHWKKWGTSTMLTLSISWRMSNSLPSSSRSTRTPRFLRWWTLTAQVSHGFCTLSVSQGTNLGNLPGRRKTCGKRLWTKCCRRWETTQSFLSLFPKSSIIVQSREAGRQFCSRVHM